MAKSVHEEIYTNAIIDAKDKTITEYHDDAIKTYSLLDLIKRWDGVVGISLTIQRVVPLPPETEGEEL